jgi:hypothetical protein
MFGLVRNYTDQGAIEGIDKTPPGADWGFEFSEVPTDVPVTIWAQAIDVQDAVGTVNSTGYAHSRPNTALRPVGERVMRTLPTTFAWREGVMRNQSGKCIRLSSSA